MKKTSKIFNEDLEFASLGELHAFDHEVVPSHRATIRFKSETWEKLCEIAFRQKTSASEVVRCIAERYVTFVGTDQNQ